MVPALHIRLRSALGRWRRVPATLVTAAGEHVDFEWAGNVGPASRTGAAMTVPDAIRYGSDLTDVGDEEADLVTYVRHLVASVSQPVYDRLVEPLGVRCVAELAATVG
jgi:hypothetical protein